MRGSGCLSKANFACLWLSLYAAKKLFLDRRRLDEFRKAQLVPLQLQLLRHIVKLPPFKARMPARVVTLDVL
jgi:hypothetical protein